MSCLKRLVVGICLIFLFANTAIAKNYNHKTLIFFYTSQCAYCHDMADILLKLTKKHKVRMIAVSDDGKKIAQLPNSISDMQLTRKFKIVSFPTLIAVDMTKKEFELMCNGLESEKIVEAKILAWVNHA